MKITEFEFSRQNYLESGSILKRTRLKMNFSADREFQMTKMTKMTIMSIIDKKKPEKMSKMTKLTKMTKVTEITNYDTK